MEILIGLLIALVLLNGALKISLWKSWQQILFCLLLGVLLFASMQYAVTLSKTALHALLLDAAILQDMAVVVTVDAALCLSFCLSWLNDGIVCQKKPAFMGWMLWAYPHLLLLPALFYALAMTVFALPGVDFLAMGAGFALTAAVALLVLVRAMMWLLPQVEGRVELHLLLSAVIAVVGLLATQTRQLVYGIKETPVQWSAMVFTLSVFALLFLIGFFTHRLKNKFNKKYGNNI